MTHGTRVAPHAVLYEHGGQRAGTGCWNSPRRFSCTSRRTRLPGLRCTAAEVPLRQYPEGLPHKALGPPQSTWESDKNQALLLLSERVTSLEGQLGEQQEEQDLLSRQLGANGAGAAASSGGHNGAGGTPAGTGAGAGGLAWRVPEQLCPAWQRLASSSSSSSGGCSGGGAGLVVSGSSSGSSTHIGSAARVAGSDLPFVAWRGACTAVRLAAASVSSAQCPTSREADAPQQAGHGGTPAAAAAATGGALTGGNSSTAAEAAAIGPAVAAAAAQQQREAGEAETMAAAGLRALRRGLPQLRMVLWDEHELSGLYVADAPK